MCAINFGNMNIGSIPLPIRQEDIPGLIVKETENFYTLMPNPTKTITDKAPITGQPPIFSPTQLYEADQKRKYQELYTICDPRTKQNLQRLAMSGKLSSTDSNDGTSTLDNLHRLATTPRYEGLNKDLLIKETIEELANPFCITQKFGNVPKLMENSIINFENSLKGTELEPAGFTTSTKKYDVKNSSTCPAASMQFSLADKKPAEYARIAADLSSPDALFTRKVKSSNICPDKAQTFEILKEFNTNFKPIENSDDILITIKPDINALVRAQIQTLDRDNGERSVNSVLMQSAFMNLASENSYNALTDKRYGKFNQNNEGLTELEKNFLESVIDDEPRISVVYQDVDDNQHIKGYNYSYEETQNHLLKAISQKKNVIVGLVNYDKKHKITNGHEITIIGAAKDLKGNIKFICNDTDDNTTAPTFIPAKELIPRLHHAGIPANILEQ